MAIMEITNVPELEEFSGTEKIYVNDNGKTKQIACDKVVTAGGGRTIIDNNDRPTSEELISMIENGDDIWVKDEDSLYKILSFDWGVMCGGNYWFSYNYVLNGSVRSGTIGMIGSSDKNRLDAIGI